MSAARGAALAGVTTAMVIGLDYLAVAPALTNQFRVIFAIACLTGAMLVGAVVGWQLAPRVFARSILASGARAALLGGVLAAAEAALVMVVSVLGTPRLDLADLIGLAVVTIATA